MVYSKTTAGISGQALKDRTGTLRIVCKRKAAGARAFERGNCGSQTLFSLWKYHGKGTGKENGGERNTGDQRTGIRYRRDQPEGSFGGERGNVWYYGLWRGYLLSRREPGYFYKIVQWGKRRRYHQRIYAGNTAGCGTIPDAQQDHQRTGRCIGRSGGKRKERDVYHGFECIGTGEGCVCISGQAGGPAQLRVQQTDRTGGGYHL